MAKQKQIAVKVRNPVAQHGLRINKCAKMLDRKKAEKRGYSKHKADYC